MNRSVVPRDEVERQFLEGHTVLDIARGFGCRYQVVYEMIRRSHDLRRRPPRDAARLKWLVRKGLIP